MQISEITPVVDVDWAPKSLHPKSTDVEMQRFAGWDGRVGLVSKTCYQGTCVKQPFSSISANGTRIQFPDVLRAETAETDSCFGWQDDACFYATLAIPYLISRSRDFPLITRSHLTQMSEFTSRHGAVLPWLLVRECD
jgi:hypothetical protein